MRIVNIKDVTYEEIIEVLNNSGIIIYPTETCYGIGVNPADQKAVDKLLSYKDRREGKAISVAVADLEMAERYVEINETARNFYERFLPGPFTIISKSLGNLADGIESEKGNLGIRVPDFPWFLKLIKKYNNPITSTSANQSYKKQPYKVADILDHSSKKALELIDLIIDGGELPHNPSSTVIDTTLGDMQVLRKGGIIPESAKTAEVVTNSEEETIKFGQNLLKKFKSNLEFRPLVFALQGDLGAGKTHLTKGIAKEMKIEDRIQSPTFILMREYDTPDKNRLYHIDTWRLETEQDFKDLGISEMLEQVKTSTLHNVVVIEWADKVIDFLRKLDVNLKIVWVEISTDEKNENIRILRWSE